MCSLGHWVSLRADLAVPSLAVVIHDISLMLMLQ